MVQFTSLPTKYKSTKVDDLIAALNSRIDFHADLIERTLMERDEEIKRLEARIEDLDARIYEIENLDEKEED